MTDRIKEKKKRRSLRILNNHFSVSELSDLDQDVSSNFQHGVKTNYGSVWVQDCMDSENHENQKCLEQVFIEEASQSKLSHPNRFPMEKATPLASPEIFRSEHFCEWNTLVSPMLIMNKNQTETELLPNGLYLDSSALHSPKEMLPQTFLSPFIMPVKASAKKSRFATCFKDINISPFHNTCTAADSCINFLQNSVTSLPTSGHVSSFKNDDIIKTPVVSDSPVTIITSALKSYTETHKDCDDYQSGEIKITKPNLSPAKEETFSFTSSRFMDGVEDSKATVDEMSNHSAEIKKCLECQHNKEINAFELGEHQLWLHEEQKLNIAQPLSKINRYVDCAISDIDSCINSVNTETNFKKLVLEVNSDSSLLLNSEHKTLLNNNVRKHRRRSACESEFRQNFENSSKDLSDCLVLSQEDIVGSSSLAQSENDDKTVSDVMVMKAKKKKCKRRSSDIQICVENIENIFPEDTCPLSLLDCSSKPGQRLRRSKRHSLEFSILKNTAGLDFSNTAGKNHNELGSDVTFMEFSCSEPDYATEITERQSGSLEISAELETLYRNKNYQKPQEKLWETIFESPARGKATSKKRLRRFLQFDITAAKLKRRLKKATENGWDSKTQNTLSDKDVNRKLKELVKL